jgi:hypothetical protein
MVDLDPAVEQTLAELSDQDWRSLSARVRPPTSTQQLREIAGKVLDGDALDSFVAVADPKKFAGENGDVDETKVMGALTGLFAGGQQPQHRNWGQGTGQPAGGPRGESARAALAKRFGVKPADHPGPGSQAAHGSSGKAELAKRYGGGKR